MMTPPATLDAFLTDTAAAIARDMRAEIAAARRHGPEAIHALERARAARCAEWNKRHAR